MRKKSDANREKVIKLKRKLGHVVSNFFYSDVLININNITLEILCYQLLIKKIVYCNRVSAIWLLCNLKSNLILYNY